MNRYKLAAMFVALLLSQHAQCADGEPAKGPLSADELAQCRTQLAEYKEGVQKYNTDLGALKAFEREVDALSAAIDKEKAAVDRRDSAAMQALNEQIANNNEMVERHQLILTSVEATASLNQLRAAKFEAACENRPLATAPASKPQPAKAAPPKPVCSATSGDTDIERQLQATFVEIRADQKEREADVERVAQARAESQGWSARKRQEVYMALVVSPKFGTFEREKKPYLNELLQILGSKPKNHQDQCRIMQRIAAMLPSIKAINARQYKFMANEIAAAK